MVNQKSLDTVVSGNNKLAFDLYSEYKSEEGNVFFSPYSISTALAMTYEGAKGETAEEMLKVLNFPKPAKTRREGFAVLYDEINGEGKKYELSTANALWAQKDYEFLKKYFETVEKHYKGKVTNLDFVCETEQSRQTINKWVEEKTNDKIKDLISQGVLNKLTRLVLTNAVYFKGSWLVQFDKEKTYDADFNASPGNASKVRMMCFTEGKFGYSEDGSVQILELPYLGKELSMLLALPKEGEMQSLEGMLSQEKLKEWRQSLSQKEVDIYIPKFKFETKYFMAATLKKIGMPTAFKDDGSADFSGMTGDRDLYISSVIHQAFVDLNEEGTEAAAATAVIINKCLAILPETKKIFRADHPFIFLIQQKNTGNILFMGRVNNPNG